MGNDFDKIQNIAQLSDIPGIVYCKCGNIWQVEKGDVLYNEKDDHGKQLTKEAAEHKAEFRVRCHTCENVFCSDCKVEPYHVGFTCQQY